MSLFEVMRQKVPQDAHPEDIAEAAIGLIVMASHRALTKLVKEKQIQILENVSSFTTTMHIDARKNNIGR